MNAFEAILAEIARGDACSPAVNRVALGAPDLFEGPPIIAAPPTLVAARYADAATSPDTPEPARNPARARSPLAWDRLLDEAERAGAPVKRLEALRRELAWAFQPDRTGDDSNASMTRFNARIDTLIARARR